VERRKAVTAAAAAGLTMLAGAAGIALNSGIVGAKDDGNVGQLSPVSGSSQQLNVDDPTSPAVGWAPVVGPTDNAPVATSSASGHQGDDGEYEDDDRHVDQNDDQYRDDEEYEGADDDD